MPVGAFDFQHAIGEDRTGGLVLKSRGGPVPGQGEL
jgi:hypothetical protein